MIFKSLNINLLLSMVAGRWYHFSVYIFCVQQLNSVVDTLKIIYIKTPGTIFYMSYCPVDVIEHHDQTTYGSKC